MIRLRGHHLICLHFFDGKGYDEGFVRNLTNVIARAELEEVEIVAGADDVCGACPYLKDGVCMHDDGADEEIRDMDEAALKLLGFSAGSRVEWKGLRPAVNRVLDNWRRMYCAECDWSGACEIVEKKSSRKCRLPKEGFE